jgi:hypothetical protein
VPQKALASFDEGGALIHDLVSNTFLGKGKLMVRLHTLALFLCLLFSGPASAALSVGDFQNAGDGLLITDDVTGLEWLTPVYSQSQSYNDVAGGWDGLVTTEGFTYASRQMVLDLFDNNFGLLPVGSPGSAAGFAIVQDIFDVFGIAQSGSCFSFPNPPVACPRTQGVTSDVAAPGQQIKVGAIQHGTNGWLIDNSPYADSAAQLQVGHWLIRPVPEPSTALLIGLGLLGLGTRRPRD